MTKAELSFWEKTMVGSVEEGKIEEKQLIRDVQLK